MKKMKEEEGGREEGRERRRVQRCDRVGGCACVCA